MRCCECEEESFVREPSLVLSLPSVPERLRGEGRSAEDQMEMGECTDEPRPHALNARTRASDSLPEAAEEDVMDINGTDVMDIRCTDEPSAPRTQSLSNVLSRFSQVRAARGGYGPGEEGCREMEALLCKQVYSNMPVCKQAPSLANLDSPL